MPKWINIALSNRGQRTWNNPAPTRAIWRKGRLPMGVFSPALLAASIIVARADRRMMARITATRAIAGEREAGPDHRKYQIIPNLKGQTAMTISRKLFTTRMIARRLAGASALAMVAAWASPAMAQSSSPGSPACPIVSNEVICSGSLNRFSSGGRPADEVPVRRYIFRDFDNIIGEGLSQPAIAIFRTGSYTVDIASNVRIAAFAPGLPTSGAIGVLTGFSININPNIHNTQPRR
jgi:hypothetical protein